MAARAPGKQIVEVVEVKHGVDFLGGGHHVRHALLQLTQKRLTCDQLRPGGREHHWRAVLPQRQAQELALAHPWWSHEHTARSTLVQKQPRQLGAVPPDDRGRARPHAAPDAREQLEGSFALRLPVSGSLLRAKHHFGPYQGEGTGGQQVEILGAVQVQRCGHAQHLSLENRIPSRCVVRFREHHVPQRRHQHPAAAFRHELQCVEREGRAHARRSPASGAGNQHGDGARRRRFRQHEARHRARR